jgi:hypothetical protein
VVDSRVRKPLNSAVKPLTSAPGLVFVKNQLWQLSNERFIKIGHVGRLLVHYRTVVPTLKRSTSRETFTTVEDLQQLLTANKAVLVLD